MKKRLWLFYPENDIALSYGTANFTAPPAAMKLHRAGEILPIWMASRGDRVLCSGINEKWLNSIIETFKIEADVWNHSDFELCPTPWGWSESSRRIFTDNGFSSNRLPDKSTIAIYRELSHRRTTAKIGARVAASVSFPIWPRAVEIFDTDNLTKALESKETAVVKAPWSSSGRGINFFNASHRNDSIRRLAGTIRKQGSVMVEDFAENRYDFAMLFMCQGGKTVYEGLSIFATNPLTGQYQGNVVARQEQLSQMLSEKLSEDWTSELITALESVIDEIIASEYEGPIGIDLFMTEQNELKMVHVVETNLRWTMGFLAKSLAKYVSAPAFFEVVQGDVTAQCAPLVTDGQLRDGTLALNPPGGDFTFILKTAPTP